jgi:hypothetical protein
MKRKEIIKKQKIN